MKTNETLLTVIFPSGQVGSELLHFMGGDDEQHYNQRPEVAKQIIDKCFPGKTVHLTLDEKQHLIREVEYALDIKKDHVGDGSWSGLQQYNLSKFLTKLKS